VERRFAEADALLERAAFWSVRRSRVDEARGIVALSLGRHDDARRRFAASRGRLLIHTAAFGEARVLITFQRAGLYEAAEIYAGHRLKIAPSPLLHYHSGVARLALNRLDEAAESLAATAAASDPELAERAAELLDVAAARRATGRADYVFDRHGAPLAGVDVRSGARLPLASPVAELLEGPFAPAIDAKETAGRIDLTLDLEFQRAAGEALGDQRGALVVMDVQTGALLAAVSRPERSPDGVPVALARAYEPGSIVKMLTLAGAFRAGLDVAGLFPMQCPGWMEIDRLAFRDWIRHGRLADVAKAMAVSCNIAFGRLGMLLGAAPLESELMRWGFGVGDSVTFRRDGDLAYRLGRLLPEDEEHPSYALARRAEGLDSVDITPIHAAMLAAGLARAGSLPSPYLVARRTNVLGETYAEHAEQARGEPLSPEQAAILREAMVRSVADRRGTGRRAAVDGITLAIKTGTSGRSPRLDALVIGYAPVDAPRVAFALVAEGAGKAELKGARITRDFLTRIAGHLQ
jgi:peptidoglycan glycosyltransferase